MMEDSYAITELDRRVSNLIQIGTVTEAAYEQAKVKVKIGDIITHWLPWITPRAHDNKTWWTPEVKEQVIVLAPSGELMQAVVLPAIYSAEYAAPDDNADIHKTVYKDGTLLQYDRANHVLTTNVNPAGRIEMIIGASKITMTDEMIRLENGGSSLVITADGIGANAGRIDLN